MFLQNKILIRYLVIFLIYGLFSFKVPNDISHCSFINSTDTIIFGNRVFSTNVLVNTNVVIFKKGCKMKLSNGSFLEIHTNKLIIEGDYFIDASGNHGANRGDWCAHNCHCNDDKWINPSNVGHEDFEKQKSLGDLANKGGKGGKGGAVNINYCSISGIIGGLDNLKITASGGVGGSGLVMKCPCHNEQSTGNSGDNGEDGVYKFINNCDPSPIPLKGIIQF